MSDFIAIDSTDRPEFQTSSFLEDKQMDPLTPDDLLIRQKPIDDEQWFEGTLAPVNEAHQTPKPELKIPLERFQTLERIIRDHPINVDPYLELARIYLQQSRWADARRILDLAVDKFPSDNEANYLREEAQINRSLQLLQEAQEEHSNEPTKLTLETMNRCNLELNVLREKVCRARLERHPDQLELNMPLATALENLGNRDEAIQCLRKAVVQPKLRASAAYQLGTLFERAKRVPEALSAYRRAAMFRIPAPSDKIKLAALTAAANLSQRNGMVDSAIRYLQMLIEMQPENGSLKARLEELQKSPL